MDTNYIMGATQENWAKLPEMAQTTTLIYHLQLPTKERCWWVEDKLWEVSTKNTANMAKVVMQI